MEHTLSLMMGEGQYESGLGSSLPRYTASLSEGGRSRQQLCSQNQAAA